MSRLVKLNGVIIVPGKAAVIGQPAKCEETAVHKGYRSIYPGLPSLPAGGVDVCVGAYCWITYQQFTNGNPATHTPIISYERVCQPYIPASPSVPAQVIFTGANTWGEGAVLISQLAVGGSVNFDLPKTYTAILIGVDPKRQNYTQASIQQGIVVRMASVVPFSGGQETAITAQKITVSRTASGIDYFANNILVASMPYPQSEAAHVHTALYGVADYLENVTYGVSMDEPEPAQLRMVAEYGGEAMGIAMMRMQAQGEPHQSGLSTFKIQSNALTLAGYAMAGVRSESDAVSLSSSTDVPRGMAFAHGFASVKGAASFNANDSRALGRVPAFALDSFMTSVESEPTTVIGMMPAYKPSALLLNGGLLSATGSFALSGKASEPPWAAVETAFNYGVTLSAQMKPVVRNAPIAVTSALVASASFSMQSGVLFAFTEQVNITHSLDLFLFLDLNAFEVVNIGDSITLGQIINLAANERLNISSSLGTQQRETLQYAVNAATGAVTRYSNFGFTQFATVNGITYGLNADCIYELAGDTDGDDFISAAIDFGAADYGTAQSKRLTSVYLGLRSDGDIYIRTAGDAHDPTVYRAVQRETEARAMHAKGVTARRWRLQLEVEDASYAELDSIEVEIGVSQRRLAGRRG